MEEKAGVCMCKKCVEGGSFAAEKGAERLKVLVEQRQEGIRTQKPEESVAH
jgi:hypothetical protein